MSLKGTIILNNKSHNALTGTRTEQILVDASKMESLASTKYKLFADQAHRDGYHTVADTLNHFANNEQEHAELWMSYLGDIQDTDSNLTTAQSNEELEATDFYPNAANTADAEGFHEIAEKFRMMSVTEACHRSELHKIIEDIASNQMYEGDAETEWKCTNCGYCTKGNLPSNSCPLCNYPKGYFIKN